MYCRTNSILYLQPWLICLYGSCFAGSMESAQAAGKSFGEQEGKQALQQAKKTRAEELMPEKVKSFEGVQAYQNLKSHAQPQSEIVDFLTSSDVRRNERENKSFHHDEAFLKDTDETLSTSTPSVQDREGESSLYTTHTCRQSGDPMLFSFERTLKVSVQRNGVQKAKVCLGHHQLITIKKAEDLPQETSIYRKKFEGDPRIKSFKIEPVQTRGHSLTVLLSWTHIHDATGCDHCESRIVKEAICQEIGEEWIEDRPELSALSKSPDSTIIEQVCLDSSSKTINGKQVERQCWKERISFLHRFPKIRECDALKNHRCEQISQRCVQTSPFGCAIWEFTFQCFEASNRQVFLADPDDLYGFREFTMEHRVQPNRSFAEVAAKLAVFDEAKKDLEKAGVFDASCLEIFKGKRMTCSKSVADRLMYDCCFNYSGLAKQMGLSKCSADEFSLAEMREEGLCHYVGSYEEDMMNLWKTRDEHVFCCYSSKLARLVQEEGRKQLKLDWGKPKKPDCGGFTFDFLAKIDFTQMDLSELFDQIPNQLPDDFQDRIQTFQNRLKDQIHEKENELDHNKRGEAA